MVVKGRTPHRRACLCCAEAGALPFSLRRANGDAALEDTWSGLNDDDDAPTRVTPPAESVAEVRARLRTSFNTRKSAQGLTTRSCNSSQVWPQQSSTLQPARSGLPRKRECRRRRTRRWPPASAPARGWPLAWCALRCSSPRECACASSRAEPPACRIQTKTKLHGVHRSAVSPAAPTKLRALWQSATQPNGAFTVYASVSA